MESEEAPTTTTTELLLILAVLLLRTAAVLPSVLSIEQYNRSTEAEEAEGTLLEIGHGLGSTPFGPPPPALDSRPPPPSHAATTKKKAEEERILKHYPPSSHGNGVRLPVEAGEDNGHQGANGREKVPSSRGWKTVVNSKTERKRILILLKGDSRRKTPTTKRSNEEKRKFEE